MIDDVLAHHPIAGGLSAAQVAQLAACARVVQFPAGAVIFREGGDANALYLITSGRVVLAEHVPGRGDLQLENLTGGDVLGLSWMFPDHRWVLDARAAEATEVLALDADGVKAAMEADTALGFAIATYVIHQLYIRLERVRLQRLDVYRGAP